MLYVLLVLVVALALVSGVEYALLRIARAERKADVAKLRDENIKLTRKCKALCKENEELSKRMVRLDNVKEGLS